MLREYCFESFAIDSQGIPCRQFRNSKYVQKAKTFTYQM